MRDKQNIPLKFRSCKICFQLVKSSVPDSAKTISKTMPDFEEHPYWRELHADNISTLLPLIKKYNEAIRKFVSNPENAELVQGFIETYRELFITEFNRTHLEQVTDELIPEKQRLKRQNVAKAVDDLFGNVLISDSLKMDFNIDLAKKLDDTIGKDLIEDAGIYRECNAKPNGYSFNYLDPYYIECCLIKLFEDINQPLEPDRDDWYNVTTDFFNRFLFIHPFRNGNGRVARILLSALLINYSIVPLCFFLWKRASNEIYLHVLAEAHNSVTNNDKLLKSFIIEVVHSALEHCVNTLEIPVD